MYIDTPFRLAIEAANNSTSKYRVGAVVFNKKAFSSGWNDMNKSHPKYYTINKPPNFQRTIHAEFRAIRAGIDFVKGSILIVVRLRKDGSLAMAKPCVTCASIAASYGVKKVYFTDNMGKLVSV